MIMPINDTENIYSTPYTEGTGNPIPATKVSYDGTGTSIEATNVQAAITEIDTDLQSTKDDVNDIKGELRDMSLDGYTITDFLSVQYTPDNDTYGTALDGIASIMNDVIAALEDDEMIVANNIVITNVATLICRNQPHYNTDTNFNAVAFSLAAGETSLVLYSAVIYGGSGSSYLDKSVLNSSGSSFENISSSSVTATNVVRLSYYKYKKIKSEG